MQLRNLGKPRGSAFCVALGCVLGVATAGVAALALAPPAISGTAEKAHVRVPASCTYHHTNVEGYDSGNVVSYGNQGYLYINDRSTLNGIQDYIVRSLLY